MPIPVKTKFRLVPVGIDHRGEVKNGGQSTDSRTMARYKASNGKNVRLTNVPQGSSIFLARL